MINIFCMGRRRINGKKNSKGQLLDVLNEFSSHDYQMEVYVGHVKYCVETNNCLFNGHRSISNIK